MACQQRGMEATCNCGFVAGDHVHVDGTGPFTISRDPVTQLQVRNTDSMFFDASGAGTTESKRTLNAEAIINGLLTSRTTGTLVTRVTGAGTRLDPSVISAWLRCVRCDDPALDNGDVLVMGRDRIYHPRVLPAIPPGAVHVGAGLGGDGSASDPLHIDWCTYDDLIASCETPPPPPGIGPVDFVFPGVDGNYMETAASSAFDISGSGDMEVLLRLQPTSWRPAGTQGLIGRWPAAGTRSWVVALDAAGQIIFSFTRDGSTAFTVTSTPVPNDGAARWLRIRRTRSSGVISIEYAPDATAPPTTGWVGIASTSSTPGFMYQGTMPVTISSGMAVGTGYHGKLWRAIVGIGFGGTPVLDLADTNTNVRGALSFTATTGGTITVHQTGTNVIVQAE